MRVLISALAVLFCISADAAEWKTQAFNFYWPAQVRVYIEDNALHKWTETERKVAIHAMQRKLWSQVVTPVSQAVPGKESRGDKFRVREIKCAIIPVRSRGAAQIIVKVASVPKSQTTLPTAGLPVTISIRSDQMTGFPSYDFALVIDHEFDHLAGRMHSH